MCAKTFLPPLQDFANVVTELNHVGRSHFSTDLFLLFELMEQLKILSSDINIPEKNPSSQQVALVAELTEEVRSTSLMGVTEYIEEIRRKSTSMLSLPPDCRTADLTVEVELFGFSC